MTGIDVIVAAPWIAFGAVLATVCWLLLRSRRASWHRPGRPCPSFRESADAVRRLRRGSAARDAISCPKPQEAQCPKKNPPARPR
jgi:hypothetical protein